MCVSQASTPRSLWKTQNSSISCSSIVQTLSQAKRSNNFSTSSRYPRATPAMLLCCCFTQLSNCWPKLIIIPFWRFTTQSNEWVPLDNFQDFNVVSFCFSTSRGEQERESDVEWRQSQAWNGNLLASASRRNSTYEHGKQIDIRKWEMKSCQTVRERDDDVCMCSRQRFVAINLGLWELTKSSPSASSRP